MVGVKRHKWNLELVSKLLFGTLRHLRASSASSSSSGVFGVFRRLRRLRASSASSGVFGVFGRLRRLRASSGVFGRLRRLRASSASSGVFGRLRASSGRLRASSASSGRLRASSASSGVFGRLRRLRRLRASSGVFGVFGRLRASSGVCGVFGPKLGHLYCHQWFILYYIICYYIYIHGQSLSRRIFDLCGFSGAGLKITFGLRVMDSMTQFWCQKVGLSRLFCVILRHIFGPFKCDWQRAKSAIDRFLVAHDFSVQTKKMQFLDVQVYIMCIYIYIMYIYICVYI